MVNKVKTVMHEWKQGNLHSGSKKGPIVTSQKQAVAIALSQQRKANSAGHGKGGPKVGPPKRTSRQKPHMTLTIHPVSREPM